MNVSLKITLIIAAVFVIGGVIVVIQELFFGAPRYRYQAQDILTPNELEFFGRLRRAAPELYFFPQVAMSALVSPVPSESKHRMAAFRRISQKRVDYAVFTEDMLLVCIVELDDKTHDLKKDAIRDEIFETAGIHTVRWHSRNKPDEDEIREQLHKLLDHVAKA